MKLSFVEFYKKLLVLSFSFFVFKNTAHSNSSTAGGIAKAGSIATGVFSAINTVEAGADCITQTGPTPWKKCVTLPLHLLATVASFMDAGQNGQSQNQVTAPMPDFGDFPQPQVPTGPGYNPPNLNPTTTPTPPPAIPFAQLDPNTASEVCSQSPDAFICKPDPYAAIDELKDNFKKAYEAGTLGGPGEGGLGEGETIEGALANFDKAKAQLNALLSNTDAFKKKNSGNMSGITAGTLSASGLSALKSGTATPTNFSGLGRIILENGLEAIDEETGKPLTLWQRATRRYQGSHSERFQTLARMESLRQTALKYLSGKGKKESIPLTKAANNESIRTPASTVVHTPAK